MKSDLRIYGEVEIHPTASLASGIILIAAPDSQIKIGSDVCLGMGVILNACEGDIEVESGAILGSGVLIVGKSQIGKNACIGSSVTIFKTSVADMTVIAPGSILGDTSRQIDIAERSEVAAKNQDSQEILIVEEYPSLWDDPEEDTTEIFVNDENGQSLSAVEFKNNGDYSTHDSPFTQNNIEVNLSTKEATSVNVSELDNNNEISKNSTETTIGKVYINQLLFTLFPHSKDNNSVNSKNFK
jgi:carbon dioxide concentrating mechanism protein CcmN